MHLKSTLKGSIRNYTHENLFDKFDAIKKAIHVKSPIMGTKSFNKTKVKDKLKLISNRPVK